MRMNKSIFQCGTENVEQPAHRKGVRLNKIKENTSTRTYVQRIEMK